MEHIERILRNNAAWADEMTRGDPEFFASRAREQAPHFLFIGCSDSRVPAEQLTGVLPGEMFIHRNIANQVFATDLNLLSVLQYGIEVLEIEHLIVCGHYDCGGVKAAMGSGSHGLVDNWLAGIRNVIRWHEHELAAVRDEDARLRRLVQLNVRQQVYNLSRVPIVQNAWRQGPRPLLHGFVYDIHDGLLDSVVLGVTGEQSAAALLPDEQLADGKRAAPPVAERGSRRSRS